MVSITFPLEPVLVCFEYNNVEELTERYCAGQVLSLSWNSKPSCCVDI